MTSKTSPQTTGFSRLIYENMLWRGLFYVSALLLNICIARYYQASASGWIFYLFNYYTLFIEVLGFSMEAGISYYASRNEITVSKLLGFSLALALAAAVPVFIFFRLYVPKELAGVPPLFMLFTAISFISGYILNNCCSALFYARRNFILPNIIFICINIALVVLLFITGGGHSRGVNHDLFIILLFASFFVQGVVLFTGAFFLLPGARGLSLPGSIELKKIARYSLQAFVANIAYYLLYRIDYWFVERYCRPEDLGNYIQVSKLVQLFLILPAIIAGVIFPVTAGGQREEVKTRLKYVITGLLLLYSIACLFLATAGKWLFPFVFGAGFTRMYMPFLFLIPGILSLSVLSVLAAYYAGKNRVAVNVKGALLSLLIILPGDIIFIPRYGIAAAALVSSAGYIVYMLYVAIVFKKEYALSVVDFFSINRSEWNWIRNIIVNRLFKKGQPGP